MPIRIGGIVVDLIADTDAFNRGFDDAAKRTETFNRQLGRWAARLSAVAGAGLAAATASVTNYSSEVFRASERLGVSARFLSEWQRVVATSGVSAEQFNDILQDMNERLGDGVALMGGEARDAATALGLSLEELVAVGPEQAFERIFEALQKVEDITLRTTLADKLFADAGQQLVGVMNRSTESIERQRQELSRLGVTISGEAAVQAEELRRRWTQLRMVGEGFANQLVAGMTPSLNVAAQAILDTGSAAEFGARAGKSLGEVMLTLVEIGARVRTAFTDVGELLGATAASVVARVEGNTDRADAIMDDFFQRNQRRADDLRAMLDKLAQPAEFDREQFVFQGATGNVPELRAARDNLAEAAESQTRFNESVREAENLIASLCSPVEVMVEEIAGYQDLLDQGLISQEDFNRAVARSQDAFQAATEAMQDNNEEHVRILRERQAEMERAQREADRMAEAAQREAERANRQMAGMILRPLEAIQAGTMTVGQAFERMTLDILRNLQRLAVNSLFNSLMGTPSGGAPAAGGFGALFSGIGSFFGGIFGAAQGADFTVPGTGGTDSKLMAMRVTPGERVTVSNQGLDQPARAAARPESAPVTVVQNLYFQGSPDPLAAQQVGAAAALALQEASSRNA